MSPQNQVWLPRGFFFIKTFISRLHRTGEENQKVQIVFAEELKYELEEEIFDKFEDVRVEIEKRTEKRVGKSKNVR